MKKTSILSILLTSTMFANIPNTIITDNKSDLKITIYNKNLAFINDSRSSFVKEGKQNLVYQGVPSKVIPESVIPTFTNIKTNLYSQNYMYDLISLHSMLKYSIGSPVEYFNNNYLNIDNPERLKGKLLSISPVMIESFDENKIITLNNQTQVVFNSVPSSMITKPSLVWNIETQNEGSLDIDLKYLTRGITWKSDYVLNLNENSLDLNGWITINNNSGVSYNNAEITCLAGNVNTVNVNRLKYKNGLMKARMESFAISEDEIVSESFSGYHIYKIPFREDIKNKQTKQITFINKKEIKYIQYGQDTNNNFNNYGNQKLVFKNIIEFTNNKENHLGLALPNGTIRMYKKDKKGDTHFIGEDSIKNTPKNEKVKLNIGTMFDVVGDKKISKFKVDKYNRNVETTYEVRNQGESKVSVRIREIIPTYGRKIDIKSSCENNCKIIKKDAFRRDFIIELAPEETYQFTSEFNIKYH